MGSDRYHAYTVGLHTYCVIENNDNISLVIDKFSIFVHQLQLKPSLHRVSSAWGDV